MYLKSIEMQGFKSFANRITLEFHDGITGIVGPNGSGKSNVADAVRWVLGEQSAKQLRGGVMQDVIFSGTELRKPLGFASVAITLDNSDHALNLDFHEVTITRRLYRSGESEYLLNKSVVKLRDIRELFYDTGVGKEGYSIIGQGQIDQILSGKPEERRELFDEAAGIVKFKRRKAQTLRKLEQEEANLVRVNDILSELSRQLGPLERQSETAKLFLAQKEEQKTLDMNFFLMEEERTNRELLMVSERTEIAEHQLADTQQSFERTREEYEKIEQELLTLDQEITILRDQANANQIFVTESSGQIRLLEEQIQTLSGSSEIAKRRLSVLDEEQSKKEQALSMVEAELLALRELLQKNSVEESGTAEEREALLEKILQAEQALDQGKNGMLELLNRRGSLKGQMLRCEGMLEQIRIRRADIIQKSLQFRAEDTERKQKLDLLKEELRKISEHAADLNEQQKSSEEQIETLTRELNELATSYENAQTTYHRDSSRLESLKNVAENYDGYNNSIRKVMEQRKNNPGIHGVIADLISSEEKYEVAIETALGGSIQNVVTDNETTAKYLIEYLKRGRFGRATFLPLTSVNGKAFQFSQEQMREPGVLGLASDLVTYEKIYTGLVLNLLGKTLVIDTIDHAIAIGRKYRHTIRMVTLEGELLSPGGSMTGGSFRNNNNLLGRRREIEELEKKVRRDSMDLAGISEKQEKLRNTRGEYRNKRNQIAELLQKSLIDLNTAKVNYENSRKEILQAQESYDAIRRDNAELEKQIRDLDREKAQIAAEVEASLALEQEENTGLETMRLELEQLRDKEKELAAKLEQGRILKAGHASEVTFQEENCSRLRSELESIAREKEDLSQQIGTDSELTEEKRREADQLRAEIQEAMQAKEEADAKVLAKFSEKDAKTKSHHQFFERRDALSGQISLLDKELYRLNGQRERLEEIQDNQINYIWTEYEMTPVQARAYRFAEAMDRNELKKKLAEVKERIRKLGHVNVNAVEEYKEVKERHTFLSAQHEDLIQAAHQLKAIIEELDVGMRKQFAEKFEEIRLEFNKVFQQLFGGGKGTLELDESEDILEAGIRIIASPPGKKLQNMMQLSGGEKALTAIALLFAIQNLKPSPFCLLDEIEAALDDSNVGRFANYLHKLSKNTQFIVITHRRGTMNAADRLYGITMQEKGVSTLVSVSLIEDDLK